MDAGAPFRLAHSLLLSRLARPCIPRLDGDARQLGGWTTALGETPQSAIERFKQVKLLVPFAPVGSEALALALGSIYGVAQLKPMLKARALKVSGKKDELIARLLLADTDGVSREIASLGLYHCSDAGRDLASKLEERKEQACAAAVAAIRAKDYSLAIRVYQSIEDDLGFPKWEFEGAARPELIELVMNVKPRILGDCSEAVLAKLRLAMALQCLSGRHAPKGLLRDVETGIRLDAETAARMIYFLARHAEDMRQWRQVGVTQVTHLAAGDSCAVCVGLNGQAWGINEAPELPHAQCTNDEYGCRCLYLPVLDF